MAHKGKLGKVLFRRDWNLNRDTNNSGFFNRYLLTPKYRTTGFGTLAAKFIYDCGPARESPFGTMRWISESRLVGPFSFHFEVTCDFGPGGWFYNKTMHQFEDHVGEILTQTIGFEGQIHPGFFFEPPSAIIFIDPTFFEPAPFPSDCFIRPKDHRS